MATYYIASRAQEETRYIVGTFASMGAAKDAIEADKADHVDAAISFGFNAGMSRVPNGSATDWEMVICQSDGSYLTAYQWEVVAVG